MKRMAITLLFAVVLAATAIMGFWTQSRNLPVQSQFVDIVGPAHPGGKLLVRWQVFRERSCKATKQELIIDIAGVRWIVAKQEFSAAPGPMGFDQFVTQTELPRDIPIGIAVLRVVLAYQCNPVHMLWPVIDRSPDIPFVISAVPGS